MTDRIREFLRDRRPEGPCLVVDTEVVRDNYLAFARAMPDRPRLLRGQGQSGPGNPGFAGVAGLVLRLRQRPRNRHGTRRRRHARPQSPTAIPSRRSATSRPPSRAASACSRSTASRRSRRFLAPLPAAACSAASCAPATAPSGRCRGSSAASPRWRSPSSSRRIVPASMPTASPSTSARSNRTRPPGTVRFVQPRRSSARFPIAASSSAWSTSAAASRRST